MVVVDVSDSPLVLRGAALVLQCQDERALHLGLQPLQQLRVRDFDDLLVSREVVY